MAKSEQQRVLITGGCGDIGLAVARRFAAGGARVMLADLLPPAKGKRIAQSIHASDTDYALCDVTSLASVQAAIEQTVQQFGGLDVSISNAGKAWTARVLDQSEDDFRKTIDVLLHGSFLVAQQSAKAILRNPRGAAGHRGSILFTGTWVQTMPWPTCAAYCAAKAGQEMLMKVLAQELAEEGITCNVVAPGLVDAGMTKKAYEANPTFRREIPRTVPLGRMSTADEVAGAFYFLAGPEAAYITGTTIVVDGGASLGRREM